MSSSIEIQSLSSSGEGVGSLEGIKVFVDGALPGETVKVAITEKKKTYAKGKLLSILSPSPDRVEPVCPLFGACGGCQIMHLDYSAQLVAKQKRVADALQRIGGFHDLEVMPCLPSPHALGYRNKIQLPVVWEKGKKTIGLYRKESHEIIPVEKCFIQCPDGEIIYEWLAQNLDIPTVRHVLIRNAVFNQEALVIFVTSAPTHELKDFAQKLMKAHPLVKGVVENVNTRSDNVILGPKFLPLAGRPHIFEKLLKKTFKISPGAFFQVNPAQAENLYRTAIAFADIQPHEVVLDAYCGVGALALFAADHAKQVYGIECVSEAIKDAQENARLNQTTNAHFRCGFAEKLIDTIPSPDTVLLNPPRKGCAPELINTLLHKKPHKLVYISCDPATLARDLRLLSPTYHIDRIQPLDMFPQTMHVETVVCLKNL